MLDARFLATISDDLVELYGRMEAEIKKDLFRRLSVMQSITDASKYQLELLRQTSGLKSDVLAIIKAYDEPTQKIIKQLYEDAVKQSTTNDLRYYSLAKRELSENQAQLMNASIDRFERAEEINKTYYAQSEKWKELYESMTRMTLTVADSTEKAFIREVNNAYLKASSGAFSWKKAYKDAVINLATDGVKTVTYTGSGKIREYTIETACKMNILTGINQTASEQTLENAENLGTNLVEVSAHIGARPFHEELQGKVYALDGEQDYIDANGTRRHALNFYTACRFGEADGICGINCRHSFYPYFEGTPLQYSRGELSEMKDRQVTLDGKKVTPYEAEQELRLCERNIRFYKSQAQGLELTKNEDEKEYISAKNNIWNWQKRARDIVKETKLQRKYINEYIGTPDGKQPTGLKPK